MPIFQFLIILCVSSNYSFAIVLLRDKNVFIDDDIDDYVDHDDEQYDDDIAGGVK